MNFPYLSYLQYNSIVILSYFFLSLFVLLLGMVTKGKSTYFFSSGRGGVFSLVTYFRMFSHVLGHADWNHFRNNFIYILLVGPMIEETYGSGILIEMILITAFVTALLNILFSKNDIMGASGISFMLILLSSLVNIQSGKIPLTFILVVLFFVVNEIIEGIFKKDNISHFSHLIGAVCGFIYGYYFF